MIPTSDRPPVHAEPRATPPSIQRPELPNAPRRGPAPRAIAGAAALIVAWALVSAWWIPRGPTTTAESLTSLVVALLLGALLGWTTGSRWTVLAAPLLFVVVFEIARIGVDGPTVDGISLSSTGGIGAFVTGRLFMAIVILLPMAWAATLVVAWRRRDVRRSGRDADRASSRAGRVARGTVTVVTGVTLLALAALVARPASTAEITGPDGKSVAGSVAELTKVEINGHDLGLMIRGHDTNAPVLLFLAGGPGGSELGGMRRHLPALEEYFVVATWDQRGTGRSYGELDPTDTLTLESSVEDTLAVTDYLRERFDQERIYLVGQSWGSTLGVLAAQAAPQRYAAFVGVGQMVSQRATDRIYYDDTLAWAQRTGRSDLVDELRQIGSPPYDDVRHYETVLLHEKDLYPYDHSRNSEGSGQMSENLFVREYSLTEQVRVLAGTLDTFAVLYPQLQDIDFRETATEFDVPMFFVQGAHETPGRAQLFEEWYPLIDAPAKDRTALATSGHRPLFEQPTEFVDYLTDVVVPRTTSTDPS